MMDAKGDEEAFKLGPIQMAESIKCVILLGIRLNAVQTNG